MKITALETYFLAAPLAQPVRVSNSTIAQVSEVIVKLTTDSGLVGIGEAHGPFLSRPGPDGMRAVGEIVQRITPLVVGRDPFNVEAIWQDMFALTYTSVRGIPPLTRQQRRAGDGDERDRHRRVGPDGQGDRAARPRAPRRRAPRAGARVRHGLLLPRRRAPGRPRARGGDVHRTRAIAR